MKLVDAISLLLKGKMAEYRLQNKLYTISIAKQDNLIGWECEIDGTTYYGVTLSEEMLKTAFLRAMK